MHALNHGERSRWTSPPHECTGWLFSSSEKSDFSLHTLTHTRTHRTSVCLQLSPSGSVMWLARGFLCLPAIIVLAALFRSPLLSSPLSRSGKSTNVAPSDVRGVKLPRSARRKLCSRARRTDGRADGRIGVRARPTPTASSRIERGRAGRRARQSAKCKHIHAGIRRGCEHERTLCQVRNPLDILKVDFVIPLIEMYV